MPNSPRLSVEGILLLIGLAIGWGINWPIMKFIISEIPPLTFRAFCLFFGGLGILALARASGLSLAMPVGYVKKILWVCLLNIVAWNVMATYGLSLLPAGRSALRESAAFQRLQRSLDGSVGATAHQVSFEPVAQPSTR